MQYLPILYKTNSTFRPAMKTLYSLPPTFVNPSPTVLPTDISISHPQAPAPNVARLCRPKHDHEGDKMNWLLATHLFDPPLLPNAGIPKAPSQTGSTCVAISGAKNFTTARMAAHFTLEPL